MSLLIKALDQAAKNKEAEQGQASSTSLPTTLNLTLEPLAEKPAVVETDRFSDALASASAEATLAQQSLEEEAGLSLPTKKTVRSKYAKSETALANSTLPNITGTGESLPVADNAAQNSAITPKHSSAVLPPVFQSMAAEQQKQNQQTAAKTFVANQQSKNANSKLALFLLAFAAVLIILLFLQGYQILRAFFAPEPVVVNVGTPAAPTTESLAGLNAELNQSQSITTALPADNMGDQLNTAKTEVPAADAQLIAPTETTAAKASAIEQDINKIGDDIRAEVRTEKALNAEVELKTSDIKTNAASRKASQQTQSGNVNSGTVQLLKKSPADGIDPHLQAAYQSFTVGDYALAQQQYRTVLQADVRNVDALLGMAAIAQRQNRMADANGWYQKVLEIEPRNSTARTAMANMAVNDDTVATESRLKSMIAEQPNNANLYATLGNVYAEKNQWSSAQEAYFNACKLAPDNADYAFNLAVSLEQLRKPKLAYVQYLRALDLRNANNASSPDKAVLEARIKALSE